MQAEMAPGMGVSGSAKCSVASTAPSALFCMPTSMLFVRACTRTPAVAGVHRTPQHHDIMIGYCLPPAFISNTSLRLGGEG